MTKTEFESKIKKLKLQKVDYEDSIINYFGNQKQLYLDKNNYNLYGCFFEKEQKEFIIFFVDSERGIAKDLGNYKTEDEAYDVLFNFIKK